MRPLLAIPAVLFAILLLGGLFAQNRRIQRLASEVNALQRELGARTETDVVASEAPTDADPGPGTVTDSSLSRRLGAVEETMAQLLAANEHLMNHGQIPLSAEKRSQLLSQLGDVSAMDRDRLQALRLLRRNGGLDDDAVQLAVGWLNGSTNSGLQLRLLQQLGGLTNAILRDPMLALASGDGSAEVRQRAIGALRIFVDDPQVESQLWSLIQKDGEAAVRRQARDALVDGPISESRLASLRERAANSGSSLDERAIAWEALKSSGQSAPEVSAALSQLALNTTDPQARIRLFETFNQASDPAFIPPLVQGLQDPSPQIRARAADALSDFRADPAIEEWFRYLAENDTDASVRRQATRALNPRPGPPDRVRGANRGRP